MRRYVRPVACRAVAWGWPVLRGCVVAWGLTFAFTVPALAQIDVLNELYGSGVHAYNSGSVRSAYADFTMAIRSGSKDPRVYYYRGLAYLRLGRPQEAHADFRKGAALEMSDADRFYPVSKSLERIQGQARAQIERYRSRARLVAFQTREHRRYERYERIRKNEPNVLMTPEEAAEMPSPEGNPAPQPSADADAETPDEAMPAEKPAADEADPFAEDGDKKEPAEEMPDEEMSDEEMPAEKPEADDPFAEDSDDKKPAAEVTEEGDEEMSADDAADESADEKKPAEDDPFAE